MKADETEREILRQYTGVAIAGRGLLIGGKPGVGKTALALCLIDRGAVLIGDDGVAVSVCGQELQAAPPATTQSKLELRNVGIIALPSTTAPVCLIVDLADDAPRWIEKAEPIAILGHQIPRLPFCIAASGPSLADTIRAEYALSMHGLSMHGIKSDR